MGKRGPKRKYACAYDFERAVNDYFEQCAEEDKFPDVAGMRIFLGLSQKTIDKYCEDPDAEEAERFKRIVETARDKRQSWLERHMVQNPKTANGCMNALKQTHNGGFVDKPVDNSERSLTINVINVGGESAFK